MLKKIFSFAATAALAVSMLTSALPAAAQIIVKDRVDQVPVSYASVFDADGNMIGYTDVDGKLPTLPDTKSISITHVAYQPMSIAVGELRENLLLEPAEYTLGEVCVVPRQVYCIRLTGFRREVRIPINSTGKNALKLSYCESKGECYLIVNSKKEGQWYSIASCNMLTGKMSVDDGWGYSPIRSATPQIEKLAAKGEVTLKQAGGYKQVIGTRKDSKHGKSNAGLVIGTVKPDAAAGIITTSYDGVYPDSMLSVNSLLFKMKIYEAKESEVFRKLADSDEMRIENLLVSSSTAHAWVKLLGVQGEARGISDFYVEEAEALTKEEYKEAIKEAKARSRQPVTMTKSQLEDYAASLHVRPLPQSVKQALSQSK